MRTLRMALAIALASGAATAKTVNIQVVLSGACRTLADAKALEIVLNGDESNPLHLTDRKDQWHWSGDWDDTRSPSFPDAGITASVRLGGARTYCRRFERAKPGKDARDVPIAKFMFDCNEDEVRQVTVDPASDTFVSYLRSLAKVDSSEFDCDCKETSAKPGKREIRDVRFRSEQLSLRFGLKQPPPPGLLVFSADGKAPSLLVQDPSGDRWIVGSAFRKPHTTWVDDVLTVQREDIVQALGIQTFRPRGDEPGTTMAVTELLDLKNMKSVAITIKK